MEIKKLIEDLSQQFKSIDHSKTEKAQPIRVLSIPVPEEYKEKYDELQALSDRKFGKLLQELIKKSIDSVI